MVHEGKLQISAIGKVQNIVSNAIEIE